MQKFFKNIIIFIFLLFVVNILYLKCLMYDYQFSKTAEFAEFKNENFEILVGGFSFSMNGIDLEVFDKEGFNSYNFSVGGAHITSTKLMLEKYLSKNKAPKYFIYGASNFHFDTFIKYKKNKKQKLHPLIDYHFSESNKFSINNIPMIKFKWIFKDLLKGLVSKNHRFKVVNGQVRSEIKRIDNTINDKKIILSFSKYYHDKNVIELSEICRKNNITLIMVEMPTWKSQKHSNKIELSYYKDKEIYFFDYNSLRNNKLKIDNKNDWTSDHHLNKYGAIKLSEILISDLKSEIIDKY